MTDRTKTRLTTKAACRVAGIDRDRFNEAVAGGDFQCAPETVPGRSRLFDEEALIGLILFQQLQKIDRIHSFQAGRIACAISDAARLFPDEEELVLYDLTVSPRFEVRPGSQSVGITDRLSGLAIRKRTGFNMTHLRDLARMGIEEERSIVGADD